MTCAGAGYAGWGHHRGNSACIAGSKATIGLIFALIKDEPSEPGLDLARPRRIHGCEVRVRDDDLVAERLQAAGDPFAVGRGLDHNPGTCPSPQHGVEALRLGPDAPLDDLTALGEDVDLAFPLVHVDANMVHGWPLLTAALTAMCSCGAAYATT